MGYSISAETHERIEANRAAGRLCQGSGRCSARATRIVVSLLFDTETVHENIGGGTTSIQTTETRPVWRWSVMVMCKKHADEVCAWPAFVNGAMLWWTMLSRSDKAADIARYVKTLEADPITEANIANAQHRMRVDDAKRAAWPQ